ncbi:MAG: hypothetical protein WAO98_03775, partial [Alphaproteobacteria bacterium]
SSLMGRGGRAFERTINQGVSDALVELGSPGEILSQIPLPDEKLAPSGPARTLGTMYNFKEIAFRLHGALITARAGLNISPTPPKDILPLGEAPRANASFAMRFMLADYPGAKNAEQKPTNLSLDALYEFDRQAALITQRVYEAIQDPYQKLMQHATGTKKLTVTQGALIRAIAVATKDWRMAYLYEKIGDGDGLLSAEMKTNGAARYLVELGYKFLNPDAPTPDDAALSAFLMEDRVGLYLDRAHYGDDGLFLTAVTGGELRSVILSNQPKHTFRPLGGEAYEFEPALRDRATRRATAKIVSDQVRQYGL